MEIETRRLQSDIDNLRTHLNGMRKTGDAMMAEINELSSMWEGDAKTVFTAQFQNDYKVLNDLADIVEKLIKDLENAREKYDVRGEENIWRILN